MLTRRGRRAIFMISVLFFSLLVTMFVVAALALAPSGLARGATETALNAADQAAFRAASIGPGPASPATTGGTPATRPRLSRPSGRPAWK